jgi:hypothetical protein
LTSQHLLLGQLSHALLLLLLLLLLLPLVLLLVLWLHSSTCQLLVKASSTNQQHLQPYLAQLQILVLLLPVLLLVVLLLRQAQGC